MGGVWLVVERPREQATVPWPMPACASSNSFAQYRPPSQPLAVPVCCFPVCVWCAGPEYKPPVPWPARLTEAPGSLGAVSVTPEDFQDETVSGCQGLSPKFCNLKLPYTCHLNSAFNSEFPAIETRKQLSSPHRIPMMRTHSDLLPA